MKAGPGLSAARSARRNLLPIVLGGLATAGLLGGCASAKERTTKSEAEPAQSGRGLESAAGPAADEFVPEVLRLGVSVENRPIDVEIYGRSGPTVFIFAAIHGDEGVGREVALRLAAYLRSHRECYADRRIALLVAANPDGLARGTRANAHGVDCNRNFPAANWQAGRGARGETRGTNGTSGPTVASEPETRAIMNALEQFQPIRVLSIHAKPRPPIVDFDGPAGELAGRMSRLNRYPVERLGARPGSFGSWAGEEKGIPVITLELPEDDSPDAAWRDNQEAILAFISEELAPPQP